MAQPTKTPVMVLQELTTKRGFPPPDYKIVYSVTGTHINRFDFLVSVAGIQATGSGSSKQIGKHEAAHSALMILQEKGVYNPLENPVAEFKVPLEDESSPYKSAINCIMDLQNLCLENKIPAPEFHEISSVGPPHAKEFTYECKVSSIKTEAKASTKKMAKQLAAKEMLGRIKNVIPDLTNEEQEVDNQFLDQKEKVIQKYRDLREIIPDKSVKIDELPNTLKKIMDFKNISFENFQEDLKNPSEESLKKILDQIEVDYELSSFQDNPPMALLLLKIDTPFVTIGLGNNFEEAKQNALNEGFEIMECFMKIQL